MTTFTERPSPRQSEGQRYFEHFQTVFAQHVYNKPAYLELRHQGVENPDAFQQAMRTVAADKGNELSRADRTLLTSMSLLGGFIEAQSALQTIADKGKDKTNEEYNASQILKKDYVIPFNQELKEFINAHPDDDIQTVSTGFATAYQYLFSRYHCLPDELRGEQPTKRNDTLWLIQRCLNGMRHEIATEGLVQIADMDCDYNVTADDDARGIDMYITYADGRQIALDVKASEGAVQNALEKNRFSRAVWTGLEREDFTGRYGTARNALSVPFSTLEARSADFIERVNEMNARITALRHTTSASAARRIVGGE